MDDWKKEVTSQQFELLKQLQDNVKDVLTDKFHDEFFVYRYLKARKFDLKKAEDMIRNSLKWRKSYRTDTILEEWDPPEVMSKYWPGGIYGKDKEGHPILWQLSKDFDARAMVKCVKKQDIVKYHIWRMEKLVRTCQEETEKRNRRIHSAMHISDLDGFHLGMIFLPGGMQDALKQVFAIFEANYPENLHSSYVINAPSVFPAIFNILKPFLNEETKRKVHILGRNWQEEIAKEVDPDQLPAFWGGSAYAPDDKCSDFINHGFPIPQKYFISEKIGADRNKMTTIMVIRGNNYNLSYDVKLVGTLIRWVFESEGHDISFGLFYAESRGAYKKKKMTEVIPGTRCDSHVVPEDGTHTCDKTGVYILQFDNSYSWVNSKTVHYEIEVLEPDIEMFNKTVDNGEVNNVNKESDIESLAESIDSTNL